MRLMVKPARGYKSGNVLDNARRVASLYGEFDAECNRVRDALLSAAYSSLNRPKLHPYNGITAKNQEIADPLLDECQRSVCAQRVAVVTSGSLLYVIDFAVSRLLRCSCRYRQVSQVCPSPR